MSRRFINSLLVLALLFALALPSAVAAEGLSSGCNLWNSTNESYPYNGRFFIPLDFFAGERITITAGEPAAQPIKFRVNDVVVGSFTSPGSFTYVVPANSTLLIGYFVDASANVFFTQSCAAGPPPPPNTAPTIGVDERTVEGNTVGGWTLDFSAIGSASDAEDGTPSVSCDPPAGTTLPLGTSTVSCTASDSGGQSASDTGSVTVVDTTAPAIACPADVSDIVGQNIALGAPTATDIVDANLDISNNAPASFAAGTTTVQWAAADDSGNAASCTQHVTLAYTFLGFFQPVENPGPNNDVLNQAKAGRVIPLKWRLLDANNNPVTDLASSAVKVTVASYSCGLGTTVDQEQEYAAGGSGLQNQGDGHYQFNWKTPSSYAKSCKTMQLSLGEGAIVHTALFKFTK